MRVCDRALPSPGGEHPQNLTVGGSRENLGSQGKLAKMGSDTCSLTAYQEPTVMSDFNRGIMKFDGADKPVVVAISAIAVLGSIALLILWALSSAYAV